MTTTITRDPSGKPTILTEPGALEALFAFNRTKWGGLVLKKDDEPDGKQDPPFPADTKPEDMETDAQRAAYYQAQARKHEDRNKAWRDVLGGKLPADLKTDLEELETLRAGNRTQQENDVAEAKKAGTAEARAEYAPKLAAAEFRAHLAHLDAERRDQIIEGLNLSSYITTDGDVDTDKVKSYVDVIAPSGKGTGGNQDIGGGRRGTGGGGPKTGSIAEHRTRLREERAGSKN